MKIFSLFVSLVWASQAQTNCTFTVTPERLEFEASGGDKGLKVVAVGTGPCLWSASSDAAWARVGGQVINGNEGSVLFTADGNPGAARTATFTVAGKAVPVTQAANTAVGTPAPTVTSAGILNAASYGLGGLVPGEIVSIFGDNLGPATLVPLQLGADGRTLFTTLGGTRVLIDGVAAPLLFSSKRQVSAIVPYGISGKTLVDVQVEFENAVSAKVTMPVALAGPALFTLDASGKGQGAFLNQDNSVNGVGRPAYAGEVLILYGTGEGLSEPGAVDGVLTGLVEPLPRTKLPVSVTVGGKAATLLYAGAAPGLVAGLWQVNVRLAADTEAGNAAPVVVTVGTTVGLTGVTAVVGRR